MLSIDKCRKIDPSLNDDHSDEEIQAVLTELYELGQLAFESWRAGKGGSKFPLGLLPEQPNDVKIKL